MRKHESFMEMFSRDRQWQCEGQRESAMPTNLQTPSLQDVVRQHCGTTNVSDERVFVVQTIVLEI